MQSNSLRATALAALSVGTLLTVCPAQNKKPAVSAAVLPGSGAAANDDLMGLPSFLLPVPGGAVEMGADVDAFVRACAEAVFPMRPEQAHVIAKEKFVTALRRSVSFLGRRKVDVEGFLLGKWPVKNSEFQVYVDRLRQANQKVRPPFHWWRWGCEEDYNKHLDDIRKEFPKDDKGPIYFWERYGHELPYRVADKKGNSIGDLPVSYVSWLDANAFAARLGMRLPTEQELLRAMRGDGVATWPAVGDDPKADAYSEEILKKLKIANSGDWVLKPVGTVQAAVGPYGHVDLFGQIWQLCGNLGYEPVFGADAFSTEWKKLQKDKIGRLLESPPEWHPEFAIAKGGSYLSAQEPVQLMLDQRAPVQTTDVLESLGFRLAKSLKPGYDLVYSLQRVAFNRGAFAAGQDIDLTAQVGAERYTLADNGFPTEYEAVSMAPANWLADEKRADLNRVLDDTQTTPIVIGGLAVTMPLATGTPAGMYTVLYREAGVPRELTDAIKKGHKAVLAEQKAKKKDGDKKEEEKPAEEQDEKAKGEDWLAVLRRYGLDKADVEAKEAADGQVGFVRVDGIQIQTDRAAILLHGYEGKVVAVLPCQKRPTAVAPFASTVVIEAGKQETKEKAVAHLRFGVPLTPKETRKVAAFELTIPLDRPAPTPDQPWRLPKNE